MTRRALRKPESRGEAGVLVTSGRWANENQREAFQQPREGLNPRRNLVSFLGSPRLWRGPGYQHVESVWMLKATSKRIAQNDPEGRIVIHLSSNP